MPEYHPAVNYFAIWSAKHEKKLANRTDMLILAKERHPDSTLTLRLFKMTLAHRAYVLTLYRMFTGMTTEERNKWCWFDLNRDIFITYKDVPVPEEGRGDHPAT